MESTTFIEVKFTDNNCAFIFIITNRIFSSTNNPKNIYFYNIFNINTVSCNVVNNYFISNKATLRITPILDLYYSA